MGRAAKDRCGASPAASGNRNARRPTWGRTAPLDESTRARIPPTRGLTVTEGTRIASRAPPPRPSRRPRAPRRRTCSLRLLLRVVLDDELLVADHGDLLALGHRQEAGDQAFEVGLDVGRGHFSRPGGRGGATP